MVSKAVALGESALRVGVVGAGIMGSNHARVLAGLPGATLVGIVDKGTLFFEWTEASEHGKGAFRTDPDGNGFSGSWGMGDSDNDGGSWTGRAMGE